MTSRRLLNEGLRADDLAGMIDPVLMIDRHVPKLAAEDDVIVIAFLSQRKESAEDLNDFIERGPFDVLDSDVSPAPDEDGNYYVFIELPRSHRSWAMLSKILDHVRRVTAIDKKDWKYMGPGDRDPYPLTEERYRDNISQTPYEFEVDQNVEDMVAIEKHRSEDPQQPTEESVNPVAERFKFLVKY